MASFGESLKRERELREISLREIADATKINIRYLEALEQNRFDTLPGGVFNKGFIRAYARFIGVEGETLVDSYLQEIAAREAAAGAVAAAGSAGISGMHRPASAPRRRADQGPGPPSAARQGESQPAAAAITLAATPAPAGTLEALAAAAEQRRRAEAGGRRLPWLLAIILLAIGGAAILSAWLLLTRTVLPRGDAPPKAATDSTKRLPQDAAPPDVAVPEPSAPASDTAASGRSDQSSGAGDAPAVPAAHGTNAGTRAGAEGNAVASLSPTPPPVSAPGSTGAPNPGTAGGMDLRVEAISPVWVQVSCDGEDRLNRSLQAGEVESLRCLNLIRVSATDAGAVRLSVNGARCAALGESGGRVEGFAIRADDFRSICPPEGVVSNARR